MVVRREEMAAADEAIAGSIGRFESDPFLLLLVQHGILLLHQRPWLLVYPFQETGPLLTPPAGEKLAL